MWFVHRNAQNKRHDSNSDPSTRISSHLQLTLCKENSDLTTSALSPSYNVTQLSFCPSRYGQSKDSHHCSGWT